MNSKIEWTDETWNPTLGCERVSAGCDNCYAIRQSRMRAGNPNEKTAAAHRGLTLLRDGELDWSGTVRLLPERLDQPLRWRRPRRVFVDSLTDLFHKDVPDGFIAAVFVVMAAAPVHTYQLLTKRHGRMRALLTSDRLQELMTNAARRMYYEEGNRIGLPDDLSWSWPLPNLHLGVSVEDQAAADLRIPALLETPAAVRWLSCEPLLGPVDLDPYLFHQWGQRWPREQLHWVVAGGESGPGARPMHPGWVQNLRDQSAAAGVPFHFKQWGDYLPVQVIDAPTFAGGRAIPLLSGGQVAATVRTPGGSFRSGDHRAMLPGDANGHGQMLDLDTFALKVGKGKAGRELDGVLHDGQPEART